MTIKTKQRVLAKERLSVEKIRQRIGAEGLSIAAMAERMGRSEQAVHNMLGRLANGGAVRLVTALRVARALGCEVAALRRSDSDAMEAGHEG